VVGAETERARETLRALYRPLSLRETPMVFTTLESAELIKYAANAFLATKISFINEMADLCERVGGDVQAVAKGMGLDGRIGPKFLHPGPGYGGSCFPKDTLALAQSGRAHNAPIRIVETVIEVNEARKRRMAARILDRLGDQPVGKRVALFGVTFKPDTDDMRDAPALTVAPALIGAGVDVVACDPQGRKEGEALMPGARWESDPYAAAQDADAIVVLTEWNMFRGLDLNRLRAATRGDALIDLRNVYRAEEAQAAGFNYSGVGRVINAPGVESPEKARAFGA
jgi:UDPglucose 6-dehydrogenase